MGNSNITKNKQLNTQNNNNEHSLNEVLIYDFIKKTIESYNVNKKNSIINNYNNDDFKNLISFNLIRIPKTLIDIILEYSDYEFFRCSMLYFFDSHTMKTSYKIEIRLTDITYYGTTNISYTLTEHSALYKKIIHLEEVYVHNRSQETINLDQNYIDDTDNKLKIDVKVINFFRRIGNIFLKSIKEYENKLDKCNTGYFSFIKNEMQLYSRHQV